MGRGNGGASEPVAVSGLEDEGYDSDPFDSAELDIDFGHEVGKYYRFMDKLTFTVGVGNVVATCFFVAGYHFIMPWFYSIKYPILLLLRFINFKKIGYYYFLMDFCYFANAYIVVAIWAFPDNWRVMAFAWGVAHGPLAWAVLAFHNSLVFHSVQKITSVFIHLTPCLTLYTIRWFLVADQPGAWSLFAEPPSDPNDPTSGSVPFLWVSVYPIIFFVSHQIFYFIVVQLLPNKKLKSDKTMLTSFRHFTRNKKSAAYKLLNVFGRRGRVPMFGLVNIVYALLTMLPAYVWFHYYEAHVVFLGFLGLVATWNGASYYVDYFSRKYEYAPGKEVKMAVPV